jgi:hypothetical protein
MLNSNKHLQSQSLEGKKVISTTFSRIGANSYHNKIFVPNNPDQVIKNYSFGFYPDISYGKINSNNTLIAYGITLGIGWSKSESINYESRSWSYTFFPNIYFQKYERITDRLFFSPAMNTSIGYSRSIGKTEGSSGKSIRDLYGGNIELFPLGLNFNIKSNLHLMFYFSNVSFNYSHSKLYSKPRIADSKSIVNDISLQADVSYIKLGIQKIF